MPGEASSAGGDFSRAARWLRRGAAGLAFATVALEPPRARADEGKRAVPDYDGRGRAEARPGAGWWALRVPLAPLYVVSEFILRRPLRFLAVEVERAELPRRVYDFFFFGPNHKAGIVPIAFAEFGFNASVGLFALWDNAFFLKGNELRMHYEGWPSQWLAGSIMDRQPLDDRTALRLRLKGLRRPDNVFYGLGPSSVHANQSRYAIASFDSELSLETRFWRGTGLEVGLGVRNVSTSAGVYGSDPSLEEAAAAGAFPVPYGYGLSYVNPHARLLLTFDTREPDAQKGSGVRVDAQIEQGADAARSFGFVRWGVNATAFIDFTGTGRVLSASLAMGFVDPIGKDGIPFTELVSLGGERWMPGFFRNRLVDRSAAVATLHYRWPIAAGINATVQGAIGNVFGAHLQGAAPGLLRFSFAGGVTTTTSPPLELLLGFATDIFDRGANIEAARVSLGVPVRL